jgi:hypothetical protein
VRVTARGDRIVFADASAVVTSQDLPLFERSRQAVIRHPGGTLQCSG